MWSSGFEIEALGLGGGCVICVLGFRRSRVEGYRIFGLIRPGVIGTFGLGVGV